jgi:exopolysaccharide production protein ExoQ
MTTAWDAFNPNAAPRRRIRGGEIPPPTGAPWRLEVKARQAEARRLAREARGEQPEDDSAWGPKIGWLRIDPDAAFAFALFIPLLFIAQLGALGAAAVAGLVPLYLFVRRDKLLKVLTPRLFIFAIPAFALISTVWSEYPAQTLRYAIELGLTVMIGVLISSARNQQAVLRALCVAFFAYVAVSLVLGGRVAMGAGGATAFSGLGESKNVVADIASTGAIISLAVLFMGVRARAWLWMGFAALCLPLDLYTIVAARSAGALLGLTIGVSALLSLAVLLFAGTAVRAWLTCMLAVILIAVGLSFNWLVQTMLQIGATVFDKDTTLTGRTYLWYRAGELIREHPVLGRGYWAFWVQGNLDAEGLWQFFGITGRGGFTFHNTAVEILVMLGWVGLAVIATTVLIAAVFLIRRFVRAPNLALVCWTAIFLYQLSRTPIESLGLVPFYFSTALAFGALGAAFGRVNSRRLPARAAYRPLEARVVRLSPVQEVPAEWATGRSRPQPGAQRLRLVERKG